ncbi:hypothetical protein BSKO_09761 [Bryopsis sp. KO-2023]|nr:hypothetical protein BSKO_09761 [Bryopsis sp. KO-2023]
MIDTLKDMFFGGTLNTEFQLKKLASKELRSENHPFHTQPNWWHVGRCRWGCASGVWPPLTIGGKLETCISPSGRRMGINGLLPVLKSITRKTHVSEYRGERVAIDAYSWLHKGAFGCAFELGQNIPTDKFVKYCLTRVNLLKSCGVIPVLVFDGARLPLKENEENSRHKSRQANREKAEELMRNGRRSVAIQFYQRSIDVTPEMAKQLIDELKSEGVEYFVAPYEADAQLAYLAHRKDVHAVITEDSDLLAYACPRVFFKFDKNGEGQEIKLADLPRNKGINLVGFDHQMFLEMCIMAGCDFLKTLQGVGMKKAHKQIQTSRNFVKACKILRFSSQSVPKNFESDFQKVIWLFRHQRVYCPEAKELVHLTPLPEGGIGSADVDVIEAIPTGDELTALTFLGPDIPKEEAREIATGNLHPMTRKPFGKKERQEQSTQNSQTERRSWSSRNHQSTKNSGVKRRPMPAQSVGISHYFPSEKQLPGKISKQFVPPRPSGGATQKTKSAIFSQEMESSISQAAPSQISESVSSVSVAKKPRLKYDLSVFKCGKSEPKGLQGDGDLSFSQSIFQKRVLDDSQESSFACGLEQDAFLGRGSLDVRHTDIDRNSMEVDGLGSDFLGKNLVRGGSDSLGGTTPAKRKFGRKEPPKNSTFSSVEIRGLDGEDDILSSWASPATPRSTPFFGKGDVSPDLLGDDIGFENQFSNGFCEGGDADTLGNLGKEDNSFDGTFLRKGKVDLLTSRPKKLDMSWAERKLGEENINLANDLDPPSTESGLRGDRQTVDNIKRGGTVLGSRGATEIQDGERDTEYDQEVSVRHIGKAGDEGRADKFFSIRHVEGFAAVARQTLDRLENRKNSGWASQNTKAKLDGYKGGQPIGRNGGKQNTRKAEDQTGKKRGLFSKFACPKRKQ